MRRGQSVSGKAGHDDSAADDAVDGNDAQTRRGAGYQAVAHRRAGHADELPIGSLLPALFMPLDPKQPETKPELELPTLEQWQDTLKKT